MRDRARLRLVLAVVAAVLSTAFRAAADPPKTPPDRISVESASRVDLQALLSGPTDWARCVGWQPSTTRVYCGCKDGVLYVWDTEKDELPTRVRAAPC